MFKPKISNFFVIIFLAQTLIFAAIESTQQPSVNENFLKLKNKLNAQVGFLDDPDVAVKDAAKIDFNAHSQSLNHIRAYCQQQSINEKTLEDLLAKIARNAITLINKGNNDCWWQNCEKKETDYLSTKNINIKKDGYLYKVVSHILANEVKNQDKYYIFYHAHKPEYRIIFDVCHQLCRWGFFRKNQPLALRLLKPDSSTDLFNEFLQTAANLKRDTKNEYTFGGESDVSFDSMPAIAQKILSLNISLFGNMNSFGDSSMILGVSGISFSPSDPEEILRKIFEENHIDVKFAKQFADLGKSFFSKQKNGFILQFFVKKDVVNDLVYLSNDGGRPFDNDITSIEKINDIVPLSKFLDNFLNKPGSLVDELSKFKDSDQEATSDIHTEDICLNAKTGYKRSLDQIQARLWLASKQLYDPTCVMIKRYNFASVNSKKMKDYYKKLNDIIDEAIEDIVNKCETQKDLFIQSPFQGLIEEMKKEKKQEVQASFGKVEQSIADGDKKNAFDQIKSFFKKVIAYINFLFKNNSSLKCNTP